MRAARFARLAALAALLVSSPAQGAGEDELTRALEASGGADVVAFELPSRAGAPHVRVATIASAPAAAVTAALTDAAHYGRLVPAIVRSEALDRRGDASLFAWEVEVPLANLHGTFELRAAGAGVELAFVDGDFAPGRLAFTVVPRADGRTIVELDARLDVRRSSWILRQAVSRSDVGEPAVLATAAWVALRAVALRAEHPGVAAVFRPLAPLVETAAASVDGRALFSPALAALAARGAAALVHVTKTGRLAALSVAAPARGDAAALAGHLADPRTWRAFPGWHKVVPMPPAHGQGPTIVVDDNMPFVDLDATWQQVGGAPARAWSAIAGDARGAWFSWDVAPTGGAAALTMSPRLDRTGSIPRRFIEAEPLLEHGLALALVFVDAVAALR